MPDVSEKLHYSSLPHFGATDSKDEKTSPAVGSSETEKVVYTVPLCEDRTYSGAEVVVSFLETRLSIFWIDRAWIRDVPLYSGAITPTVMML
jgi:hypothetical protein